MPAMPSVSAMPSASAMSVMSAMPAMSAVPARPAKPAKPANLAAMAAVPEQQVFHLHPYGWENDPAEERFKVSTLDYLTACTFNMYALFFRLDDGHKPKTVAVLRKGLERTIAQARHLCGTIEKDGQGGHSFVKRKDSTVRLFVQRLDRAADRGRYPSFDDIERGHFGAGTLGDLKLWSVAPMTYGEKPEAHPDSSPIAAAFKANFIRGGLVLVMHNHHYANDVMGWAGFTRQLAENCRAVAAGGHDFPLWDMACNDLSRLCKAEPCEEAKVEGPPPKVRHPAQIVGRALLFHLPKSKAAELKRLATPTDGTWISTYDAFSAFIWRNLTRIRLPVFRPALDSYPHWCEAVDMRRRMHSPAVPARLQHNVMSAALSSTAPVPQLTVSQLLDLPLSAVAAYIRKLTASVTQEALDQALGVVATVRDKTSLNLQIDAEPPMSILQTDHRDASVSGLDFGFGAPAVTYRHVQDCITNGVIIVYPPRSADPESDEGPEFSIFYERDLAQTLIEDPEWSSYFEYRGVDGDHAASAPAAPPLEVVGQVMPKVGI